MREKIIQDRKQGQRHNMVVITSDIAQKIINEMGLWIKRLP